MKKLISAMCMLPFAIFQAYAGEFTAEPSATAYWQIPLASTQTGKERHAFGFRMDQVVRDNTGNLVSSFSAADHAPTVDLRFNTDGMQGVYVRGVNMATPSIMKMGVVDTALWVVGGFALGAAAMIIDAENHDNSCPPVDNFNFGNSQMNVQIDPCAPI
jgi:hypothetical protein